MANDQEGRPGLPEPTELFEYESLGENDEDLELVSDDLRRLCQSVAEANLRSLERVYARLHTSNRTRPPISPTAGCSRLPFLSSSLYKSSHAMETLKTPAADAAPMPRRSTPLAPSRLASVAAVLATTLLLTGALWGFLYFRGVSTGPSQLAATSRCTSAPFATDSNPGTLYNSHTEFMQPTLNWSTRGDISYAMPTEFFAGNTCASQPIAQAAVKSLGGYDSQAVWSPDGTRLLLLAQSGSVVDATTGHILVSLQMSTNIGWGLPTAGRAVWTADGTQIVALTPTAINTTTDTVSEQVKVWNSQTGALLRTALSLTNVLFGGWISPNGAEVAVMTANHSIQFWNIATGRLVSATPPNVTDWVTTVAWSSDGSLFAYGINIADSSVNPGQVQIVSSSTGQIVATLTDTDTFADGLVYGLAWSPNGRYLAETSAQINIWDTSTWQRVATFGTVMTRDLRLNQILTVAWSPDGSMLASVATLFEGEGLRLEVWQLS
jgi:hypothetical protein